MNNTQQENIEAPKVIQDIANWHYDRDLILGATTKVQTSKLLEEFIELVAAQHPGMIPELIAVRVITAVQRLLLDGRIKTVNEGDEAHALKDAIGDMAVVAINIAEREGFSYTEALQSAYAEISDRKGKKVNGVYVKEEDLTD